MRGRNPGGGAGKAASGFVGEADDAVDLRVAGARTVFFVVFLDIPVPFVVVVFQKSVDCDVSGTR
jgi:hypothetical protein